MANYCAVCSACSCGTTLYEVNGKYYCSVHKPVTQTIKADAQVLTLQQKINLKNSG